MLLRALDALREAVQTPGNHQSGNIVEKQVVESLLPFFRVKSL
jgi:hypothetical protein